MWERYTFYALKSKCMTNTLQNMSDRNTQYEYFNGDYRVSFLQKYKFLLVSSDYDSQ